MDPVKFGNKCEELMWQKVFYEPIRVAKTVIHVRNCLHALFQGPEIGDQTHFIESYRAHLISALGFYQNLLVRLQQEFYRPDIWPDAWRMVGIHRISCKIMFIHFFKAFRFGRLGDKCCKFTIGREGCTQGPNIHRRSMFDFQLMI